MMTERGRKFLGVALWALAIFFLGLFFEPSSPVKDTGLKISAPSPAELEVAAIAAGKKWNSNGPDKEVIGTINIFFSQDPCRALRVLGLTEGQLATLGHPEREVNCSPPYTEDRHGYGVYLTR